MSFTADSLTLPILELAKASSPLILRLDSLDNDDNDMMIMMMIMMMINNFQVMMIMANYNNGKLQ